MKLEESLIRGHKNYAVKQIGNANVIQNDWIWWRIQMAEWSCMDMNGGVVSPTNFIGKRIENKRHMSSQY